MNTSARSTALVIGVLAGLTLLLGSLPWSTERPAGAAAPVEVPRYAVLHHGAERAFAVTSGILPTWRFKYVYQGTTYKETFVGANPASDATTTIPTYLIPVKLKLGSFAANPEHQLADGRSVVENVVTSPVFQDLKYVQGGVGLGTTQYIDAFQRASLWGTVSTHRHYHLLLSQPTLEPLQTLTVPPASGTVSTISGTQVIVADINWYDAQILPLLTSLKIPADALPVFVITQSYLSDGSGCCIGGYHSYSGFQAYASFSYIQTVGAFSQDVSALSHEVAEYVDDPFTDNVDVPSSCAANGQQIYEVGDPVENEANYGDYPYPLLGFTYHLQDLVMPTYFGAPAGTSVNGWDTFQGTPLGVCQNGG
jgi:hypothetical protein